jgi:hypothetical protein
MLKHKYIKTFHCCIPVVLYHIWMSNSSCLTCTQFTSFLFCGFERKRFWVKLSLCNHENDSLMFKQQRVLGAKSAKIIQYYLITLWQVSNCCWPVDWGVGLLGCHRVGLSGLSLKYICNIFSNVHWILFSLTICSFIWKSLTSVKSVQL